MEEKNLCRKVRKVDNPYEIWQSIDDNKTWTWRVLKKYQKPSLEAKNPHARWFCAVSSPYTGAGYGYGDVYVNEIKSQAKQVQEY